MRRRRFVRLCAVGSLGSIGGCASGEGPDRESPTGETDGTARTQPPASIGDVELPVPGEEIDYRLARDAIPAVVEPAFAMDWNGLEADDPETDTTLPDDVAVLGVARDGRARAYPLRILDWHEVVNDDLGGPIAVTYCVLCGSGVVVERTVAGQPTIFGVSGALWRDDLLLYDEATRSLWSQLLATAIRGERTGERLRILPSSLTTWGEWRSSHPETRVLLPPPNSNTLRGRDQPYDYFEPKYGYGDEDQLIGFDSSDGELGRRTLVVGVATEETARAYPFPVVTEADVVNDDVGSLPVVVAAAPDGTLVAYDRRVGGRELTFSAADGRTLAASGSRWERTTGRALDGPYEGTRLERANEHPPMFWLGWSNFHPETDVYGVDT